MSEPKEAVEIEFRARIPGSALEEANRICGRVSEILDRVEKLRPLLEKAGAIAQLVQAVTGKKP
jgi:hypothetical protein